MGNVNIMVVIYQINFLVIHLATIYMPMFFIILIVFFLI